MCIRKLLMPSTVLLALFCVLPPRHALAVPSFARQTKLDCMSCHLSWPELTPTGRQFKLNGYTLGDQLRLPLAGMLQVSASASARVDPSVRDSFPKDASLVLQQASVFASGKISEHGGAFTQWSYDGLEHRFSIDNADLRYARRMDEAVGQLLYGFTLHNNPTVQDVYNTGPAWSFPYAASPVAATPNAAPAIESLGQQVAGLGAYALWRNTWYGELTVYRSADRAFSLLRAGTDRASDAALKGYNPYWRLALQREWQGGKQSAMAGAYGLNVRQYPDNALQSGPTNRYKDLGADAQYQYITDRHRLSLQLNHLREKQYWDATPAYNRTDTLWTSRAKASYYYQKKFGVTFGHFSSGGSADAALYDTGVAVTGSVRGRPGTSGRILELNYLPARDVRLTLQYTWYRGFNGAGADYDGHGRDARANNTLYLLGWFMF